MLLRAYLPNVVNKFRIYAFYFDCDRYPDTFDCLVAGVKEPSGIDPKVKYMLSINVYLNLSYSFFKADNLISNLVNSYFCFLRSSLNSSSLFYLVLMTLLSLKCSSLALLRSACRISTIF